MMTTLRRVGNALLVLGALLLIVGFAAGVEGCAATGTTASGMVGTQLAGCEYFGRLPTLQEPALDGAIRCGSTLGGAFYGVVAQGHVRAVVGEPADALEELRAAPPD